MNCLICTDFVKQIMSTRAMIERERLCTRLLQHKLRDHHRRCVMVPWAAWPPVAIYPRCLAERIN